MRNIISFIVIFVYLISLSFATTTEIFGQQSPRRFYNYDVIATTTPNLEVYASPSINDYGEVAFAGRKTPGGGTVFLSEIGQSPVDLMPSFSGSPQQFVSGRVQINNLQEVIQHTFISGTNPTQMVLRRLEGVNQSTLLAFANGAGSFNDFDQIWAGSFSINDLGEPVFLTRQGNNTTILTTGIRPNFSTSQFPSQGESMQPMISDSGCVVVRAGASVSDPLRLYSYDLTTFETIASLNEGFTEIGRSNSISSGCEVIAFYGNLNQSGADALGTNPGPGIFASIGIDNNQRKIVRLAGRLIEDNSAPGGNDDGYCDPGEICIQGELGFNQAGNPIFFNSFDALERVAVTHQSVGATGIQDDIFVVSFLGTPNIASDVPERPFSNQKGLWTLTTQIIRENSGDLREKPAIAVPVVQLGDVIEGRTVTGINVYDQIGGVRTPTPPADRSTVPDPTAASPGDHRLAFHINTNNGNLIIRAKRNVTTPVIFIPGIAGSKLVENNNGTQTPRWLGVGGVVLGSSFTSLTPSTNPSSNIFATDALRKFTIPGLYEKDIYESFLNELSKTGGLSEYQVEDDPDRRTVQGCDMNQRFKDPKLFVFAYDWRLENQQNAVELKSYVQCIQRFYPGTKVDIVAHSMGGLLARRYIIENPTDHSIRKMVSIGSPYLGAPKALNAIETGRFGFLPDALENILLAVHGNKVKNFMKETKAVHELFPSEAYFTLGGKPFIEESFDFNGDMIFPQIYTYNQLKTFFNIRFSTSPYSTNELFHDYPGQDDWQLDTSGVEYFHIFGREDFPNTVEQMIATPVIRKPFTIARDEFRFRTKNGVGDGTVPQLSAERCKNFDCEGDVDLNAPNATVIEFSAETPEQSKQVSHLGLMTFSDVINEVLINLDLMSQPVMASSEQQNKEEEFMKKRVTRRPNGTSEGSAAPLNEGYYTTIVGVDRLKITDNLGNTNTPIGDVGFELAVPSVRYGGGLYSDVVNVGYHEFSMPASAGEYTVKFQTGTDSIDIEVLKGVGNYTPNMAIRYIDLDLPANVECILTFNPQGVPDLRYDSDGNGTYDTIVPAHVRVTGAAAQDTTAPTVTIDQITVGNERRVTINAVDTESGVGTIYYRRVGEPVFQAYTEPFFIPSAEVNRTVEAFADDNVGNRSSPIKVQITP